LEVLNLFSKPPQRSWPSLEAAQVCKVDRSHSVPKVEVVVTSGVASFRPAEVDELPAVKQSSLPLGLWVELAYQVYEAMKMRAVEKPHEAP